MVGKYRRNITCLLLGIQGKTEVVIETQTLLSERMCLRQKGFHFCKQQTTLLLIWRLFWKSCTKVWKVKFLILKLRLARLAKKILSCFNTRIYLVFFMIVRWHELFLHHTLDTYFDSECKLDEFQNPLNRPKIDQTFS